MRFAAFDPGLSGAGVILDRIGPANLVVDILDLPTHGEDSQCRLNAPVIANWLLNYGPSLVVIEAVTAMPPAGGKRKMGSATLSRFFRAVGALEAAIACSGFSHRYVTPQVWKSHHRLKGPDKEASRQRALEMVPQAAGLLSQKKDHGRAEALLMAIWLADQHHLSRAREVAA